MGRYDNEEREQNSKQFNDNLKDLAIDSFKNHNKNPPIFLLHYTLCVIISQF